MAVHNLGVALKKKFNSKLILEYRDPGVFGYKLIFENEIMSIARKLFLRRNEIKNLESGDLILAISDSIKGFFPKKYHQKIEVVKNGFSNNHIDFSFIIDNNTQFILAYLGSVYSGQLDNLTFFYAIKKFIDRYQIPKEKFLIKFVGLNNKHEIDSIIEKCGLKSYLQIIPKVPLEEAYTKMYDVSMFFHLKYGDRKEIITTKQYDYLAFQKPILLPLSDDGDLAESIKKYNAGYICNNESEIVEVLHNAYKNHFNGAPMRIKRTESELYELSRQSQEDKLIKLIKAL